MAPMRRREQGMVDLQGHGWKEGRYEIPQTPTSVIAPGPGNPFPRRADPDGAPRMLRSFSPPVYTFCTVLISTTSKNSSNCSGFAR
jgi:hypothetical protein